MLDINTAKYNKTRRVKIDGIEMEFKAPGAGSELAFSQRNRRLEHLQKKLDNGTATDADIDKMDALESSVMDFFNKIIVGVDGNDKAVRAWLDSTPIALIEQVFKDIQNQVEQDEAESVTADQPKA